MNLKKYKFPDITDVDLAFSTSDTEESLLKEAEERGYLHGNKPANKIFATWFFNGVKSVKPKNVENSEKGFKYCLSLMKSFAPKHEHKEAVCAMLIDEFIDVVPKETNSL